MFVSGSNAPRRPALPIPTRQGSARVQPVTDADAQRSETGRCHDRRRRQPADPFTIERDASIARQTSAAGVSVQHVYPHPRRGLRADASERKRYRNAYDSAQSLTATPQTVRRKLARTA